MYILQHGVNLGQKRMERKEGQYKIVIFTTYTSISMVCLHKSHSSAQKSLLLYIPPPATGCIHTGGRITHQSIAMIQTQYSQTMQTDVIKYFIFIYIYLYSIILKPLCAAYVTGNKISNTNGNILNAKPCVVCGRFYRGITEI